MHIPACETTELELIRFDRALEEADRPSRTMTRNAGSTSQMFTRNTDISWAPGENTP